MATTVNKQRILNRLLSSPLADVPEPEALPVLEQFIFALCRENATLEQLIAAFAAMITNHASACLPVRRSLPVCFRRFRPESDRTLRLRTCNCLQARQIL